MTTSKLKSTDPKAAKDPDVEAAKRAMQEAASGEITKQTSSDAQSILDAVKRRKEIAETVEREKDDNDYHYVLRCGTRRHHGIYFTRNPLSEDFVEMNEWFSTYKGVDDIHLGPIVCQECRSELNKVNRLSIEYVDQNKGTFRVSPRHVRRFAKNEDRLKREGEHRAADMPYESMNLERHRVLVEQQAS